jgi:1-acyl-sn-glycerol-3-phosphate acyltransferase
MLYRVVSALLMPAAWWGRLRTRGLEEVPLEGPVLLVPNHDSQWDPVLVALGVRRRRAVRFLARANLWGIVGLGPVLNGLKQIPIERGAGDRGALGKAVSALRGGDAVCVFPEGKLSGGDELQARSGVAWLARQCPEAKVVLCAVSGTTGYVARFPRRPRVEVRLFTPAHGQPVPGEEPGVVAGRLLDEVREIVPPVAAGRG